MGSRGSLRGKVLWAGAAVVVALVLVLCFAKPKSEVAPDLFGICTANLDGSDVRRILSDSWREMTHIRVSPDHRWITFSRYNTRQNSGIATEEGGYDNTEVLIARIDGSDVRTVVAARPGRAAVNSSWTPDGRALIYLEFGGTPRPQIRFAHFDDKMDVAKTTTLPLPDHLLACDPSQVGDTIVFPARDATTHEMGIWLADRDGSDPRRITLLRDPDTHAAITSEKAGENDPKLSPDGSKIAFMRYIPHRFLWHTFVVDVAAKTEKDLSAGFAGYWETEGIPEWSSDGKRLITWHADLRANASDLYTMRPDGSDRRKVPLPQTNGVTYDAIRSPAFFPGTDASGTGAPRFGLPGAGSSGSGSGPDARIVFAVKRIPAASRADSFLVRVFKVVVRKFL